VIKERESEPADKAVTIKKDREDRERKVIIDR
jgi:hypothetical protein